MDGLRPWAKLELQRRGVQNITEAISMAKSMVELHKFDNKPSTSKSTKKGKNGGDPNRHYKEVAMVQGEDKQDTKSIKLGFMLLNIIEAKQFNQKIDLMVVDIMAIGQIIKAFIDMRALDLFMVEDAARKLGLKPN
ncbi:Uncharacterized protein TCM_032837 [Theobroma cacao]|uniref:Uncharacterized protein n=1 Tax=Theobroma cacao TaxID=3641 RepID=A0A061FHJ6_THECC|nr:Uncharacterized protein TCM_032837 [Theobroma cacao]